MSDRQTVHLSQIDPLRGVAILLVILFHSLGAAYGHDRLPWNGMWRSTAGVSSDFVLLYPVTFGFTGVSLFFVISGFVIHYSTANRGELDILDYTRKRFWRIYPPYFVAMLVFTALQAASIVGGRTGVTLFASHVLLIHNLRDYWIFGINPSFWSLATECQLYLLYPALWAIRDRFGSRAMLGTAGVVSIAIRISAELYFDNEPPMWASMSALTLWFDWTLGAYLCDAYLEGRRVFARPRLFTFAMLVMIFAASLYRPTARHVFFLTSIMFTAVLEAGIWSPVQISRSGRLLAQLGVCSYSIYLFHQPFMTPVSQWLMMEFGLSSLSRFLVLSSGFLFASWAIGPLLYRWIEVPSAQFGRRQNTATRAALFPEGSKP